MLLQSLKAHCLAPGGPGSIWNYLGAPVRSAGVSRRFACGFRTDLHFADEDFYIWWILIQVYIENQPEKFPKGKRAIDWIGSLMESYAAS
jgi:hypothetical protein